MDTLFEDDLMSGTKVIVNPPQTSKVTVSNAPIGRIREFFSNPQIFRILGAADLLAQNPTDGQVVTWDAANNGFVLAQPAAVQGVQNPYDQANTATFLAQAAFNRANVSINNSFTIVTGSGLTVNSGISLKSTANGTFLLSANVASVTTQGVVQLSDVTNSSSTTQAATANAVASLAAYSQSVLNVAQAAYNTANAGFSANNYNFSVGGGNSSNIFGSLIQLPNNSFYGFTAMVAARDISNNAKLWRVEGGIKNTASNTTIIGTPVINIIAADNGTSGWTIALASDNINEALLFQSSGAANVTAWVVRVDTVEIG